ncbi:MAG: ABC transporter permease subunit [Chloroflexi bacterium]|nr:ABC transporter permease subunit [Chloroflexota bacterium]
MSGSAIGVVPPVRRRPGAASLDALRHHLPAIVLFLVVIAVWEYIASSSSRRVIPPPSSILGAIQRESDLLWRAAQATYMEAIGGLIIGSLAGVLVGFATARWAIGRDILVPIAVGASTIPLIAIAPIINNWFGTLNPLSKMMMAALLVFFPVVINVTRGLVEVQPAQLELMRSYASTPTDVLRKVRVPNMLPFLFTALKVATTLAFIGALVGEYFGGTSAVIGRVVLTSMSSGSLDLAWAGIIIAAVGAIASYLVVVIPERMLIPSNTAVRAGRS